MDLLEPFLNTGFTFRRSSWWYYNNGAELRGKGTRDDLNQNFNIEKIDTQKFYMKTVDGKYLCLETSGVYADLYIIRTYFTTPDEKCVLYAYKYNQQPRN